AVLRQLRIHAEWTSEGDLAVIHVRSGNSVGRRRTLDPLLQSGEHIELIGSGAAAAMVHARYHEQAEKVLRALQRGARIARRGLRGHNAIEVVDAIDRRDIRIAKP